MCVKGQGVDLDYGQAFFYFQRAAENNCALGNHNLGVCYDLGCGTTKDIEQAKIYYKK